VCWVCVTCTYSGVDMHPSICTLIQMLMYVEVSNIMECNQHVPDPNKHKKTPRRFEREAVALVFSWEHIVDRRERRRHSHARTQTDTRIRASIKTHGIRARTRMHARACTHVQTSTHTRTQTHSMTVTFLHFTVYTVTLDLRIYNRYKVHTTKTGFSRV